MGEEPQGQPWDFLEPPSWDQTPECTAANQGPPLPALLGPPSLFSRTLLSSQGAALPAQGPLFPSRDPAAITAGGGEASPSRSHALLPGHRPWMQGGQGPCGLAQGRPRLWTADPLWPCPGSPHDGGGLAHGLPPVHPFLPCGVCPQRGLSSPPALRMLETRPKAHGGRHLPPRLDVLQPTKGSPRNLFDRVSVWVRTARGSQVRPGALGGSPQQLQGPRVTPGPPWAPRAAGAGQQTVLGHVPAWASRAFRSRVAMRAGSTWAIPALRT